MKSLKDTGQEKEIGEIKKESRSLPEHGINLKK
jgi:hypothetical protein